METLDFHVEIGNGSGDDRDPGRPRSYEVTLRGSDGDEASEVRPFPLTPGELRALDTTVPHAVLSSAARLRRTPTDDERPVRELGRRLYEFLLDGKGRPLLTAARHRAARDDRPLRIVLRVRPPELARLPWEFLFDTDEDSYLCQTVPLVRRPEVSVPERPLTVRPPLRVLCMAARPDDREPLAVRAEQEWLGRALSGLRRQGLIDVAWTAGPTWRELRTALHGGPWHAFHFIGHGGFDPAAGEGTLALSDDEGGTYHLGAEDLAMLLSRHTSLRLVVLNACETGRSADRDPFSSVAGALMRKGLPAAVAMQYPISNDAAVEFSRTFYESLAHRRPVDEAVTEARQSIRLARRGTLEWVTPVLFMRSLDGRLFDLAPAGGAVPAADAVHDLYVAGLAALRRKRWPEAVEIFREVMVRDPAHPDASAKHDEALRLRRLHDLYEAGLGAIEERRWDAAVDHLTAVAGTDPGFLDTQAHLTEARRRSTAEALHAEATALHAAAEWEAVIEVGVDLAALLPENPDPDGLIADARSRLANPLREEEAPGPGELGARTPGTAESEGAHPAVSEPGPRGPGIAEPGSTGPVLAGPGPGELGARTPGTAESGGVHPAVSEPDPVESGSGEPGIAEPGSMDPVPAGPGPESGPREPGPGEAGVAEVGPAESVFAEVESSGEVDSGGVSRGVSSRSWTTGIQEWAPPVVPERAPASARARVPDPPGRDVRILGVGRPLAYAFSPDGARFVIGSADRKVLVGDVAEADRRRVTVIRHDTTLERLQKLTRTGAPLLAMALAPGGRQLITYAEPALRTWDVDTRSLVAERRTDEPAGQVALGRDGLNALVGSGTSGGHHWTVAGRPPRELAGQEAEIGLAVTSPDGSMFATVDAPVDVTRAWMRAAQGIGTFTRERYVRVWDAATGRLLAERNCGADVVRVALHPHNTSFATGHGDGRVRVWGPEGPGVEVANVGGVIHLDFAYNADGTRIAVTTNLGVTVRDLGTDDVVCSRRYRPEWTVRAVAFGPDDRARALVSRGHEVWLTTVDRMAEGIWDDDRTDPERRGAAP